MAYQPKVGDKVCYFRKPDVHGTVIQIEGGKEGEMTEIFWPQNNQALWLKTQLIEEVKE